MVEIPVKCGFPEIGLDRVTEELIRLGNFLDEAGVPFFLIGGTCLGLVRNKALIPYDKDIDIGVIGEENLRKALEAEKKIGYYDASHIVDAAPVNGKVLWLKKVFDGKYTLPIALEAHYVRENHIYYNRDMGETWKYRSGRVVYPRKFFDTLDKVEFRGCSFNVPSYIHEYLTAFYGADWRTPKEYTDWRYNCFNLHEGYWG